MRRKSSKEQKGNGRTGKIKISKDEKEITEERLSEGKKREGI